MKLMIEQPGGSKRHSTRYSRNMRRAELQGLPILKQYVGPIWMSAGCVRYAPHMVFRFVDGRARMAYGHRGEHQPSQHCAAASSPGALPKYTGGALPQSSSASLYQ